MNGKMTRLYRIAVTSVVVWVSCTVAAYSQEYSLRADAPNVVTESEIFRVVYTATGKTSSFTGPDFADFHVLAGPSEATMSSTQFVNGKMSHTYEISYTYMLQAKSIGTFTIPEASAVIEKKTYSSGSVRIEVVKDEQASADTGGGSRSQGQSGGSRAGSQSSAKVGDIQLRLTLNKTSVVKGEPVIATLKLYSKANISGFEDVRFPTFNGFWSQEIDTPHNIEFQRETLNGVIYDAALLRKWMLLPQQSGDIAIEPAELVCAVQVRSSASGGNSIFDDFFDSYQTVRKRVSSGSQKVTVRALPSGAPKSFTGGVGEFKMDVKVIPDSVKAHEAASLMLTISGSGNLNLVDAPSVTLPPDFEVYDVKRTDNVTSGVRGTSGTKSFEYPFIPRSHGDFTIPGPEFTYYDVKSGRYVTLHSAPIPFKVGRGDASDARIISNGPDKQSVKVLGEDIRFIRTVPTSLESSGTLLVSSVWMFLIPLLLLVLFFFCCSLMKKYVKMKADVAGVRNRKANSVARARLRKAGGYLKQNLNAAFYEELHKAIEGYLSDKFRLDMTDLNRETIENTLISAGRSRELTDRLLNLLDACDFARYAPSSGTAAMTEHYNEALDVIAGIEKQ